MPPIMKDVFECDVFNLQTRNRDERLITNTDGKQEGLVALLRVPAKRCASQIADRGEKVSERDACVG